MWFWSKTQNEHQGNKSTKKNKVLLESQYNKESKKPKFFSLRLTTKNPEVVVNTNWGRMVGPRTLINGLNESPNQTNENPKKIFFLPLTTKTTGCGFGLKPRTSTREMGLSEKVIYHWIRNEIRSPKNPNFFR